METEVSLRGPIPEKWHLGGIILPLALVEGGIVSQSPAQEPASPQLPTEAS